MSTSSLYARILMTASTSCPCAFSMSENAIPINKLGTNLALSL